MSFVLIKDGQVAVYPYSLLTFRVENPSVSLPIDPTENQLNEQDIYTVEPTNKPAFDPLTQDVKETAPQIIDGVYSQSWEIVQLTPEEIEANVQSQWADIRVQRDGLLASSDWTQLPDVFLPNKDLWIIYRQNLRDITNQADPYNIVWPSAPNTIISGE